MKKKPPIIIPFSKEKKLQRKKNMRKRILAAAMASVMKVFEGSRSINSLWRFSWSSDGLDITTGDSFHCFFVKMAIRALPLQNSKESDDSTLVLVEGISKSVLKLLKLYETKGGMDVEFKTDGDVRFMEINKDQPFHVLPFTQDYTESFSVPCDKKENYYQIEYVFRELMMTLLNANVISGRTHLTLNSSGLLSFVNSCECASASFEKRLKMRDAGNEKKNCVIFEGDFVIKFVNFFSAISRKIIEKKCTLALHKQNQHVRLTYGLCPQVSLVCVFMNEKFS
jgi:hypothetical protein